MKPASLLNTFSSPYDHKTSVHSHLQSTAYHYNSILNARSQIDNSKPDKKIFFNAVKNKHNKNVNIERINGNKKLLKSMVDIQRNYSLYGYKQEEDNKNIENRYINISMKNKKKLNDMRRKSLGQIKTLKNPFVQKMENLKISQQNAKLCQKIVKAQSSIVNKKLLNDWNRKINYYTQIMQGTQEKSKYQTIKNKFFATFARIKTLNLQQNHTIRIQPSALLLFNENPQQYTIKASKKLLTQPIDMQLHSSMKLKLKKKRRHLKRISLSQHRRQNSQKTIIQKQQL